MFKRKLTFVVLLVLLPLFLGFSEAEEAHGSPLTDILGKTVNFIILFGGLGFLLAKPVRRFLEEAGLAVEKTIQKTERARKEAEQKLEALKERMSRLESDALKIRDAGREAGQRDSERLLAQARQEVERVKSLAELEIKAHSQAVQSELKEYAAGLAVSLAETNIKRRMTPQIHARLIDGSIRQLDRLYEKAHSD
jgi:F-type H+-transporting ATPase subunit b